MAQNCKISVEDITWGPEQMMLSDLEVFTYSGELEQLGYRRVSNAYCLVARIDRDDWLDVLAEKNEVLPCRFLHEGWLRSASLARADFAAEVEAAISKESEGYKERHIVQIVAGMNLAILQVRALAAAEKEPRP